MSPDTTLSKEIATEQRYLDRVYARLEALRQAAAGAERDGYRLANVGNLGALVERDAMVFHAARRRATLDAEHEGLVFGRLDRADGSVQYVGRLGIRDHDTTPLVIDWRAPAAADFYQATPADPRGVLRRRMIRSRGERVVGLDDELLDPASDLPVVGDGALLASLGRATGPGMRDIVATIQREQDEVIRAPSSGVTVVEGGPGTGKTAVALHRAAYLLYRERERFAGGGVLIIGPSAVFMSYISTVLPSLGEHSATLRSLGDLVDGVSAQRLDPPLVAAVKGSSRMRTVLHRAARAQAPDAPTELRLTWRHTVLRLDGKTLERIRRRALPRGKRRNEVRRAAFDAIFDALWQEAQQVVPDLTQPRVEFEDELTERDDFRDFLRAWWPLVTPTRVLGWLADRARLSRHAAGVLASEEVTTLAESFAALAEHGPTVADVALLDELDELLGTPPRRQRLRRDPYQVAPGVAEVTTYADRQAAARAAQREVPSDYRDFAHVVVDESQDVSPMQWRMVGRRGQHASWTVVGDPAQSAWAADPDEVARAREATLRGTTRRFQLSTNYRNSAEIFALAARVIRRLSPDATLPTAVRQTGVEPVERTVPAGHLPTDVARQVDEMLAAVAGTVGVITPEARRGEVAGWLTPDPRLQVVTGIEAKGMEYDGVVLVEPVEVAAEGGAAGLRTLYVALSRATQRLTVVGTRPWQEAAGAPDGAAPVAATDRP